MGATRRKASREPALLAGRQFGVLVSQASCKSLATQQLRTACALDLGLAGWLSRIVSCKAESCPDPTGRAVGA
ncbi:unnamed protein product [Rangifer tarandus platyrhynchus]|uniref:Uncharacterized protein n=2 Tax=Rangifer tarandus platyrhynchus TaxID=3082113 RepID=A0ACB0FGC8_RANTA|nr:unnamed protein product [Rangifer tarandus platyrhynchus]CAI9711284.1 unnamed protein product [Rangifer tarandus platyrhynchus]